MNLKEIIDNVLNEEEGGEILRFNEIKFYISGRTEGKKPHLHFKDANRIGAIGLGLQDWGYRIGAIRLDISFYFPHGNPLKYTDKLTKREVKIFAKLFTDGIYKQACELWNLLPDTLKLDGKNKPNYLMLRQ